jgi:hypothetical protein
VTDATRACRAESDRQGFLFVPPVSAAARAELDLYLLSSPERESAAPLFPAPRQRAGEPAQPMRRDLAMTWLAKAGKDAKLPKLRLSYNHADAATVLRAVEGR